MQDPWKPPEERRSRFNRESFDLTFREKIDTRSALERALPALLGLIVGGGLGALAWLALPWLGR